MKKIFLPFAAVALLLSSCKDAAPKEELVINLQEGDNNYPLGTYAAGQLLLDKTDPYKVIGRLSAPFFYPTESFEKSGQYADGTVFVEGLAYFKKKWFLYYGCADSKVGVAICNPLSQKNR